MDKEGEEQAANLIPHHACYSLYDANLGKWKLKKQ